jgi:putative oxidoreductase
MKMKYSANDYAALLLRSALGLMFIAHGLLKFLVFTLAGTAGFFESVGFPGWTAYAVAPFEVLAGVALILGIYTRRVAGAGVIVLLGALLVHSANGWLFTNKNGGWEYPAFLVIAAIAVALLGSGRIGLAKSTAS